MQLGHHDRRTQSLGTACADSQTARQFPEPFRLGPNGPQIEAISQGRPGQPQSDACLVTRGKAMRTYLKAYRAFLLRRTVSPKGDNRRDAVNETEGSYAWLLGGCAANERKFDAKEGLSPSAAGKGAVGSHGP
jgi:hypothetical protein